MRTIEALLLRDDDELTVKDTGVVVNVCGDPWKEETVVFVPTVDSIGCYHVFSNDEIT